MIETTIDIRKKYNSLKQEVDALKSTMYMLIEEMNVKKIGENVNRIADYDDSELREAVEHLLSKSKGYSQGDVFGDAGTNIIAHGMVTGSTKRIIAAIPVTKSLENISSITFSDGWTLEVRGIKGYVGGNNETAPPQTFDQSNMTVSIVKNVSANLLVIYFTNSIALTNVTNNTPVSIMIKGQIIFS